MSGRGWTGLVNPRGNAFPQGCGRTGHRGQSPPLSRHRPLCGNAGGTLAWALLRVHTPSGARGLGGQLLFLASGDLVGLHARGASLPKSLFSFRWSWNLQLLRKPRGRCVPGEEAQL